MTRQQLLFVTSAGQGLAAASDQLAFGKTLALGFHLLPQACTTALPARYQLQDGTDCTSSSGRTAAVLDKQTLAFGPIFKLSRHCSNGFLPQQKVGQLQLHSPSASSLAAAASAGQVSSFASSSALAAEPAAAAPPLPSSSSSSSSATRQLLEQQLAPQPPWLGFDIDVAGFSKKGYMRGGGKEQNQDRGLIMQQFRSPGELLLGVMDGHGTFGHLVSTFLIQHLPAVLMQKVVAAAAGLVLQGRSSSSNSQLDTWQQQQGKQLGKRDSKQQQPQQQPQQRSEALGGSQLPYVVIPDHRGEAGSHAKYATAADGAAAAVANSSKHGQARHGRAVGKHQVVPQPQQTARYSLQDSLQESLQDSSSSRPEDATVAVPKAMVDQVPICQRLLTNVFAETDQMLLGSGINTLDSGSTAVLCHIGSDSITTAWVGDSRAVLGRRVSEPKAWNLRVRQQPEQRSSSSSSSSSNDSDVARWQAIPLSDDHKPERPDEQLRIVLNDGRIQQMTNRSGQGVGPFRVWFKQLDYPGLAMSRAFGDTPCRRIGVTVEPELYVHRLTPQDELLIVASDGVWEYLNNEQVVEIAGRAGSAESAARRVVEAAEAAWRATDGGQYVDDITAVVLRAAPRGDGGSGGRHSSKL